MTGEQNEQVQAGSPPRQPLWHGCNQQRAPTNSEINSIETVAQRIHAERTYVATIAASRYSVVVVVVVPPRIFPRRGYAASFTSSRFSAWLGYLDFSRKGMFRLLESSQLQPRSRTTDSPSRNRISLIGNNTLHGGGKRELARLLPHSRFHSPSLDSRDLGPPIGTFHRLISDILRELPRAAYLDRVEPCFNDRNRSYLGAMIGRKIRTAA